MSRLSNIDTFAGLVRASLQVPAEFDAREVTRSIGGSLHFDELSRSNGRISPLVGGFSITLPLTASASRIRTL